MYKVYIYICTMKESSVPPVIENFAKFIFMSFMPRRRTLILLYSFRFLIAATLRNFFSASLST